MAVLGLSGEKGEVAAGGGGPGRRLSWRRERSIQSLVSFSWTPFWERRERRVSKRALSRGWSWFAQEKTTVSLPVTGSRWVWRHWAQISFIMHCMGELM